jgi:two-component system, LytTR family, sensor kinase
LIPLNDRWLRIIGLSLLSVLYILSSGILAQPFSARIGLRIALSFGIFIVFWHTFRALILFFSQRFPRKQQTGKRLLLTSLVGIVIASGLSWLSAILRFWVRNGTLVDYHNTERAASFSLNSMTLSFSLFGIDLFQSILITGFYLVIYETFFFIRDSFLNQRRLRQVEQEQEKLRTASLQSQLDALKQQVNPHFLFNSLNALDSLIEEDPVQARAFLDELCTVYRYLLRFNRDSNLTDLSSELDFIQSYFHLLKTRHGAGLNLHVSVPDQYQTYLLPPLTLQLLVENAVKHNVVLPEQPLHISIRTEAGNRLVVSNNLQRKNTRILSNQVGLTNIATQYRLLGGGEIRVDDDDQFFTVTLPLLRQA